MARVTVETSSMGIGVLLAVLVLHVWLASGQGQTNIAASPLSFSPTRHWDGDDGPWSTISLQVGTPLQPVRLLPATEQSSVLVVLPEGCTPSDVPDCTCARGFDFKINQSLTWSEQGQYELAVDEEVKHGYGGNARYGYDTVTLGWKGEGLSTVPGQVIAGFATKDFFIGSIPLNPTPFNFSNFNDPKPSLLQSARDAGQIRSRSWAYTAGSYRHLPKAYGSLTLGGYDSARFVANDVTFALTPDSLQDVVVAVQSITTDTAPMPLLSAGIYMPINSMVSHIWLPVDVCIAFERAFGLVWDNATDLYLVGDEQHDDLTSRNPNVTLKLGPSLTGPSVDIVMPYSSFDLTAGPPLVDTPRNYFPLRRAVNDTQYKLGRAFLQSVYLIADYDRSTFSVSQALFPGDGDSDFQKLVAIVPPTETTSPRPSGDPAGGGGDGGGLSPGAIGGISAGAAIGIGTTALAIWFIYRRRRQQPKTMANPEPEPQPPYEAGDAVTFSKMDTHWTPMELEAKRARMNRHELADPAWPPELSGTGAARAVTYELPANQVAPASTLGR